MSIRKLAISKNIAFEMAISSYKIINIKVIINKGLLHISNLASHG